MGSDVSTIETAIGARDWALSAMGQVASARKWTASQIAAGGLILTSASAGIGESAPYWARVVHAWDATIAAAGAAADLPAGWDKLGDVWRSARDARVSGVSREDLESWWTQATGAAEGIKRDVGDAGDALSDLLVWVRAHPWRALAIVASVLVAYNAAPLVVARLVTR